MFPISHCPKNQIKNHCNLFFQSTGKVNTFHCRQSVTLYCTVVAAANRGHKCEWMLTCFLRRHGQHIVLFASGRYLYTPVHPWFWTDFCFPRFLEIERLFRFRVSVGIMYLFIRFTFLCWYYIKKLSTVISKRHINGKNN